MPDSAVDQAARLAPLLGTAAIIGAVTYGFGFFRVIGEPWLSSLTLQDLFALAWSSLPANILGYAIGRGFSFLVGRSRGAATKSIPERSRGESISIKILMLIAFLGTLLFAAAWPALPAKYLIGSTTVAVILILITDYAFSKVLKEYWQLRQVAVYVYTAAIITYGAGITAGAEIVLSRHHDTVFLKHSKPICVTLVFAGSKGVTYTPSSGTYYYAPWDSLAGFSRGGASCQPDRRADAAPHGSQTRQGGLLAADGATGASQKRNPPPSGQK